MSLSNIVRLNIYTTDVDGLVRQSASSQGDSARQA